MRRLGEPSPLVVVSLFVGLCFSSSVRASDREPHPNVLLISIDALRADHLSCYGYARDTSPHIDRLAEEGVLFLDAFSHAPATTESHMSIMTSLHHEVHQVRWWGKAKTTGRRLADSVPTLAEILREEGYATAAFTSGGNVSGNRGFDKGFSVYERYQPAEKTLAWLKKNGKKKFFIFFHTYAVHAPYTPPPPFNKLYVSPDYGGRIIGSEEELKRSAGGKNASWYDGFETFWESVDTASEEDVAMLKALYDGSIRFVDERMIGRLVSTLKKLGVYRNTLIIITSDHGEAFGGRGHFGHRDCFAETLHVPLIMTCATRIPGGIKRKGMARLTDIMPTLLELIDVESDVLMQGESLMPSIGGEEKGLLCYSSVPQRRSIRSDEYAYVWDGGREYFYNRRQDPAERNNIIASHGAEAQRLKDLMRLCQQRNRKLAKTLEPPAEVGSDEETMRKLRSLGYMQ